MASRAKVTVGFGSVLITIALISGFALEHQMYGQPYINSTLLTAALIVGAIFFGLLAAVGLYTGLRFAKILELQYRFGFRVGLIYLAVVIAIGFIPVTARISSDDLSGALTWLLVPCSIGIVLPGIIPNILARIFLCGKTTRTV